MYSRYHPVNDADLSVNAGPAPRKGGFNWSPGAAAGTLAMVLLPLIATLVLPGGKAPQQYRIVVVDRSGSIESGCQAAVGDVSTAYDRAAAGQQGLVVELYGSGDKNTALEPVRHLFDVTRPNARVMDGKGTEERSKQGYLERILRTCEAWGPVRISAIHLAVRRAFEQLGAQRDAGAQVEMHVITDLEENADHEFRAQLQRRPGDTMSLSAGQLDNSSLSVSFCGYSATRGAVAGGITMTGDRSVRHTDRMIAVWKKLFVAPDSVTFRPFCAQPPPPFAHAAER